jgi:uncharacterized repeat protein (TIGR03803 family)
LRSRVLIPDENFRFSSFKRLGIPSHPNIGPIRTSNLNVYEAIPMKSKKFYHSITPPLAIFIAMLILAGTIVASEPKEKVLHRFGPGNDGAAAYGRVISDAAGNLYGTTAFGGTSGAGIVFELANAEAPAGWTETTLYNFTGGSDGSQPYGGLIFDSAGNLYGTTYRGGTSDAGTVYQLTPPGGQGGTWTETVLYSFAGDADGLGPQSDLNFDHAGNLYGTTNNGGSPGNGIVFQLTPGQGGSWTETVLHRFMTNEGTSPRAAVIFDSKGSLYGTLANDGTFGAGGVFRLKPPATKGGAWTEETLYTFTGGADGFGPLCRLILLRGKLYGTTVIGGGSGVGTVFELSPPASHDGVWTETTLHTFACGSDGCYPWAGLTMDRKGTFYGTTQFGGLPSNGGTVFQLKLQGGIWTEGVVFSFKYSNNQLSAAGLLLDKRDTLYGTTIGSGMDAGMVFKLCP